MRRGLKGLKPITGLLALALGNAAWANHQEAYLIKFRDAQSAEALSGRPGMTGALARMGFGRLEAGDALLKRFARHPGVLYVERDTVLPPPAKPLDIVDDASLTWGLKAVRAPQAWARSRGAGVRVAVLDTGVDAQHPALVNKVESMQDFVLRRPGQAVDDVGHGTHVAGTILGGGLNGMAIGVAPEAKLLAGKVCGDFGCPSSAIVAGLDWAIREKVDVVNMSLGGPSPSAVQRDAVARAESAGVIVVAAAGNSAIKPEGRARVGFPAAFPGAIAVGALDPTLGRVFFSQFGPELAVMAPGVDVRSSVPRGTGTLMTLQVAGSNIASRVIFGSKTAEEAVTGELADVGSATDIEVLAQMTGKIAILTQRSGTLAEAAARLKKNGAVAMIVVGTQDYLSYESVRDAAGSRAEIPCLLVTRLAGKNLLEKGAVPASVLVRKMDEEAYAGTSMASPHVAGVVALMRAVNRSLTTAQARALLKSTAKRVPGMDAAPIEYGAGLVDAEAAVNAL